MSKQTTNKSRTATATAKLSKSQSAKTNGKSTRPARDTSDSEADDDLAIDDSIEVQPSRPTKAVKPTKKPTNTIANDGEPLTPREKRLQAKLDVVSLAKWPCRASLRSGGGSP